MNDCTFNATILDKPERIFRAWVVWLLVGLWVCVGLAALVYWMVK